MPPRVVVFAPHRLLVFATSAGRACQYLASTLQLPFNDRILKQSGDAPLERALRQTGMTGEECAQPLQTRLRFVCKDMRYIARDSIFKTRDAPKSVLACAVLFFFGCSPSEKAEMRVELESLHACQKLLEAGVRPIATTRDTRFWGKWPRRRRNAAAATTQQGFAQRLGPIGGTTGRRAT